GQTVSDVFTYTNSDNHSATSSSTLTVTVTGTNDAPIAVADAASATEAGGVNNGTAGVNPTGNVLANDTDIDSGDTKTVQGVAAGNTGGTLTTGAGSTITGAHGSLVLNPDGSYSYTVNNSDSAVEALRTNSDTLT